VHSASGRENNNTKVADYEETLGIPIFLYSSQLMLTVSAFNFSPL